MICIDVDNTLMNRDKVVSAENQHAITTCINEGNLVYLVSGRPYIYLEELRSKLDSRIKIVGFNGAAIELKKQLFIEYLQHDDVVAIMSRLQTMNLEFYIKTFDKIFCSSENMKHSINKSFGMTSTLDFASLELNKIIKFLIFQGNKSDVHMLKLKDYLSSFGEITYYEGKGIEIVNKGCTKGKAIKKISKELNISKENIIVFGDDVNDLSMFEYAGNCVAPKNAHEEILKKATLISTECDDSSVAFGLKKLNIIKYTEEDK